jgi:uncharacterized protein (TIGR02271 family)
MPLAWGHRVDSGTATVTPHKGSRDERTASATDVDRSVPDPRPLSTTRDAALNSGWDVVPDVQAASITSAATTTATGEDELRIPVMEEELTATVREREAGAVRIEKDVVTEEQTLEVPVTEERVRVERRVVDRPVSAADADAFEETVIEVPLRSEEVVIQKRARVAEEVVISKEATQRTERVADTVRREEVVVDEGTALIDNSERGVGDRG